MAAPLDSLNPDFRDILGLFAEGQVEFLLVGAYALALHGAPRATGDIDLLVRPHPKMPSGSTPNSPASARP
jgi:hypothetical protein